MKKITFLLGLIIIFESTCFGQEKPTIQQIPQEQIYLHINDAILVPGESFYYKIYNVYSESNQFSNLSKVAYLDMINDNGELVHKETMYLTDGEAFGDFFIPDQLRTGRYKIIAYTMWMRNFNSFHESDIIVINPHDINTQKKITSLKINSTEHESKNTILDKNELSLSLNSTEFETRKKVQLTIFNKDSDLYGKYSISVKKKTINNNIKNESFVVRDSFYKQKKIKQNQISEIKYKPEFRGKLIQGKVVNKNDVPVSTPTIVSFTIPENPPVTKLTSTNEVGEFYFNIIDQYSKNFGYMQINSNSDEDKILIHDNAPIDYSTFKFEEFSLSDIKFQDMIERDLNGQIENSYLEVKQDSTVALINNKLFYMPFAITYVLDDFKRFSTVKETFVEVIENAWISSNDNGNRLKTKTPINSPDIGLSTLLLVDGIVIQNHDDFINFDVKQINKISVVRELVVVGNNIFSGLIAVETKALDFKNIDNLTHIKLDRLNRNKFYFSPDYSEENNLQRIPDFREQLYWNPRLRIESNVTELNFFTSDVTGSFEIRIEGFSHKGKPISISKSFSVF